MYFCTRTLGLYALVGFSAGAITVKADPVVDVITGSAQIGQMDLATGTFAAAGSIPTTIQYLVSQPNGSLLTMDFGGNLEAIDPRSGAISVIGPTGFTDCTTPVTPTCGPQSQLSLGSAGGIVYATDFANNLYTVNPSTGKATLVGPTGIPAVPFIPASTNPDGSFNFYDENLFGAGGRLYANFDAATFNPATSDLTVVVSPNLYQIDPSTGHATLVAPTDPGLITIVNVNGSIYAFNGLTGEIVTLNVANGQTSFVSNIDPALGLIGGAAPAAVPEPGSVALAAIGVITLAVFRRKGAG